MRGSMAVVFALVGCGGAPASVPTPAVDAGADDAPLDVVSKPLSICPTASPQEGSACNADASLVCEYGDAESPSCDALFVCAAKQCTSEPPTWRQIGLTKTCPIPPPSGCAPTFEQESTADGGACTGCLYAEGACACAGNCAAAPSNCPALASRPRLGTPCNVTIDGTPPNDSCPFQFDAVPLMNGCYTYACSDGVWRVAACAVSLAPPPC